MGEKVRSVKGMRDLLPPETAVWAAVEDTARRVFGSYGYGEIRTPVVEPTELFVRGVGESTDIVGKEMYSFEDRKGRPLTLRPESTAPVARAFVEHGLGDRGLPVKLYYCGPQFRYERPQRGRYRQFSQIGAELIGDPGPTSDVEVILMLVRFLEALDFTGLTVLLNTVGDEASRASYRETLLEFLRPHADRLGKDSRRRLETNPLRILDTKAPAERELLSTAPRLEDSLSAASRRHFEAVQQGLERAQVSFSVEPRLVRGLDYYSQTVFEIVVEGLGAQDAVVGGGRYDGLISDLGGAEVPGIGFAIGEDRLLAAVPQSFRAKHQPAPPVHLVAAGTVEPGALMALAETLREQGLAVVSELGGRSVKAALKRADKSEARWVVLVGDDELEAGEVTLRDLAAGQQERLEQSAAIAAIKERS